MTADTEFLIVTNKKDLTSDFIIREMRHRKLNFFRLNTEDAPDIKVNCNPDVEGTRFRIGDRSINIANIKAAYFRRPLPANTADKGLSQSSKVYVIEEWNYFLRSLYLEIGSKWFSHPNKIILAEDKPMQLRLAKKLGFNVPKTVITNEIEVVAPLFDDGDVVAKPLKHSLLECPDTTGSVIFTSVINSVSDIRFESLSHAPVIFQRKIEKEIDLRVTVVGDQVFAVSIDSQAFKETETDWRHSSVSNLDHEIFDLPNELAELCRLMVKRLQLRYGAIDLVMDRSGKFWFLECNPNGQWAWIENRTGLPISAAIVDEMEMIST